MEKKIEQEDKGDTSCNWCARYGYLRSGGIGNKRTSVKIGQNTKKIPGDSTEVLLSSANAGVKYTQKSKIIRYIADTTWTDYMYQEKKEEEDLPASKTALSHPYNDSKTT